MKSISKIIINFIKADKSEEDKYIGDFYYANYALNLLTICWLGWQIYIYSTFSERPTTIFEPINYFQKLFLPHYPPVWLYYGVMLVCFVSLIYSFKKSTITLRLIITFCLLYLNALTWGYQFNSHVTHILILGHLFKVFLPHDLESLNIDKVKSVKAIKWCYAGILVTYSFSGIWKVVGLVYKFTIRPQDVNWLDKDAMQFNAIVGYRIWDLKYDYWIELLGIQPLWQIVFVIMIIGQLLSVCFVFRKSWLYFGAIWTAMFHVANIVLFKVIFVIAPIAVLTIFMPWLLIITKLKTLISTPDRL